MTLIALKAYSVFKERVPEKYYTTTGKYKDSDNLTAFREIVGDQIQTFKRNDIEKTANQNRRHDRWKDWIRDVPFDDDLSNISEDINDDTITAIIANRSGSSSSKPPPDMKFYLAVYYRLHAFLKDMSYADAIDTLVFGSPLRSQLDTVFIERIGPIGPYIHPPYKSKAYVRQRLEIDPADGIWLDPHNHHSIKLSGRAKEMSHLSAFMGGDELFRICPVIGPSGAGKTRLISEWMKPYVPAVNVTDWDAGFVIDRQVEPWSEGNWHIKRNTLLVIDYTFAYADVVTKIAERARKIVSGHKIRLIVIDHVFPQELFTDTFWEGLYSSRSIEHGQAFVGERYETLTIKPEGSESELLRGIIVAVARNAGKEFGGDHPKVKEAVHTLFDMGGPNNPEAVRHPLFAALIGHALGQGRDISHWNRRALVDYYFSADHRLPWKTWTKNNERKRWGLAVGALVSAATFRRGLPVSGVRRKLPGDPKAVLQYASRIVSSEVQESLKPFEPDLLGEAYILKFLEEIENKEIDADRQWAWEFFLTMLQAAEDENDKLMTAENFLETSTRLVRNLLNDDQQSNAVKNSWSVLDGFLMPKEVQSESMLRHAILIIRADSVRQCRGAGQDSQATRFAKNIDLGDMRDASSGPLWRQATNAYTHYFDFRSSKIEPDVSHLELLSLLGRNLFVRSGGFESLLLYSIVSGCRNTAKFSLNDPEESVVRKNTQDKTALMMACENDYTELIPFLLKRGADINDTAEYGWTALISACDCGSYESAAILLENDADIHMAALGGYTALVAACHRGASKIVSLLLNNGAEVNRIASYDGSTALIAASLAGHLEVVEILLKRGAYVNVSTNDLGLTALMAACEFRHTEIAALLLKSGADANIAMDSHGWTPLMTACAGGLIGTVSILLESGANINCRRTDDGLTALDYAISADRSDIIDLLRSNGAKSSKEMDF